MRIPEIGTAVAQAERAEALGWTGITFTDSQNLIGDPFVAVALAANATERLRFATGVTNAFTRHPAQLANVAATVQETSGGRFVLGIGRGDTAMFHLGRKPMPVAAFVESVTDLQTYLGNGTVDCNGFASRLRWLDRCRQPKVPLDIAVSGPRLIEFAARIAERVTLRGRRRSRARRVGDRSRAQGRGRGRPRPRRHLAGRVRERGLPSRSRRGARPDRRRGRRVRALLVDAGFHGRGVERGRQGDRRRGRPPLRQQRAPEQRGRAHLGAAARVRRPLRHRRRARRVRASACASSPISASSGSS